MKNVLVSAFIYESIHEIIKIHYYDKMTSLPDYISVNLIDIKQCYWILIYLWMDSYIKHDYKTFFVGNIFGDEEYFSSCSQNKFQSGIDY